MLLMLLGDLYSPKSPAYQTRKPHDRMLISSPVPYTQRAQYHIAMIAIPPGYNR